MHSLGHSFVPPPIHAGGLRYHGMAPLVSQSIVEGLIVPESFDQVKCYEAAITWARTEGIICAPETSHAVAAVIEKAVEAREEGKEKSILFCFSGHGLMDLAGYDRFFAGELSDYTLPPEDLAEFLDAIKDLPKPEPRKSGKW
jgi:tryptophan synthase beta chain